MFQNTEDLSRLFQKTHYSPFTGCSISPSGWRNFLRSLVKRINISRNCRVKQTSITLFFRQQAPVLLPGHMESFSGVCTEAIWPVSLVIYTRAPGKKQPLGNLEAQKLKVFMSNSFCKFNFTISRLASLLINSLSSQFAIYISMLKFQTSLLSKNCLNFATVPVSQYMLNYTCKNSKGILSVRMLKLTHKQIMSIFKKSIIRKGA